MIRLAQISGQKPEDSFLGIYFEQRDNVTPHHHNKYEN